MIFNTNKLELGELDRFQYEFIANNDSNELIVFLPSVNTKDIEGY